MTAAARLHLQQPRAAKAPESTVPVPRLFHRSMPGYQVTELVSLPNVAAELGVAEVLVKDECERFELPSFKILGGSWAVHRLLSSLVGEPVLGRGYDDLVELAKGFPDATLVTATDGNHGRGVARMARLLGLSAVVMVPDDMVASRRAAIAEEGARVEVIAGDYDDAVRAAAELASESDQAHLLADVALHEDDEPPRWVVEGYHTIFDEVAEQTEESPTCLVVQAGVGALAAAALGYYEAHAPQLTGAIVEPVTAACLLASAEAGSPVQLEESQGSMMAGLNCGSPSSVAWPVIRDRASAFVAIDDDLCAEAMRVLAGAGVVAGESGAAGLAGLMALAGEPPARQRLGLDASARVLTINTEGATDPDNYRRIVGATAEEVRASKVP